MKKKENFLIQIESKLHSIRQAKVSVNHISKRYKDLSAEEFTKLKNHIAFCNEVIGKLKEKGFNKKESSDVLRKTHMAKNQCKVTKSFIIGVFKGADLIIVAMAGFDISIKKKDVTLNVSLDKLTVNYGNREETFTTFGRMIDFLKNF